MAHVKSTVTMNWGRIRQLSKAAVTALEQTGEALHTEVVQAQVVPRDTGNLQGEAFWVDDSKAKDGKVTLVHSAPYARRLYYHPEYNFKKHENPNAKGEWLEDWLPGGKKQNFAKKVFKELYKRLGGV